MLSRYTQSLGCLMTFRFSKIHLVSFISEPFLVDGFGTSIRLSDCSQTHCMLGSSSMKSTQIAARKPLMRGHGVFMIFMTEGLAYGDGNKYFKITMLGQ